MDWQNYLKIAQELYDRKGDLAEEEACCRASISRAYFAAFNFATIRLETRERGTKAYGGSQEKVIEYYKQHPEIIRKKIGNKLDRLKDRRGESDYQYYSGPRVITNYPSASGICLKDATAVISLLNSL